MSRTSPRKKRTRSSLNERRIRSCLASSRLKMLTSIDTVVSRCRAMTEPNEPVPPVMVTVCLGRPEPSAGLLTVLLSEMASTAADPSNWSLCDGRAASP